jgi:hypothetical protein
MKGFNLKSLRRRNSHMKKKHKKKKKEKKVPLTFIRLESHQEYIYAQCTKCKHMIISRSSVRV